jgi:hypothetical protein
LGEHEKTANFYEDGKTIICDLTGLDRKSAHAYIADHADQTSPDQIDLAKPLIDAASVDLNLCLVRAEIELAAEREKNALLQCHLDDVRRMLPAPDLKLKRGWWPF